MPGLLLKMHTARGYARSRPPPLNPYIRRRSPGTCSCRPSGTGGRLHRHNPSQPLSHHIIVITWEFLDHSWDLVDSLSLFVYFMCLFILCAGVASTLERGMDPSFSTMKSLTSSEVAAAIGHRATPRSANTQTYLGLFCCSDDYAEYYTNLLIHCKDLYYVMYFPSKVLSLFSTPCCIHDCICML